MDLLTLRNLFPNASQSTIQANTDSLAPLQGAQRERDPASPLDRSHAKRQSGKGGVEVCVLIIGVRQRPLDDDNFEAGCKNLRDSIAASLGCDDGDKRLMWQYAQVVTGGNEGTIVLIERV